MSWQLTSLVCSVLMAAYVGCNEYFKVKGLAMVFWRSVVAAICTLPFLILFPLPEDPIFIYGSLFLGLTASLADALAFEAAARFGGAVISRLVYLSVWFVFPIWFLFEPETLKTLLSNMPLFMGIVACLLLAVGAVFFLKKDPVSKAALIFMLPTILIWGANDITAKFSMTGLSGALIAGQFLALVALAMIVGCVLIRLVRPDMFPVFASKKVLVAGGCGGIIFVSLVFLKFLVMIDVPNPAYFGAITTISAVWLYLLNRLLGRNDKSNAKAGFVLLFSTTALILLTGMI